MDKARFERLTKEQKENLTIVDFTVSEILELIAETPLKEEDIKIAKARYVRLMTYEQIAEKIDRDTKTVKLHIGAIKQKINDTIKRIVF